MIRNYIKCANNILVHKWFVFVIGRSLGVPLWNLIIHDLSKFLPSEFPHLVRKFFDNKEDKEGFSKYYLLHTSRNAHHPRYWIDNNGKALPIPTDVVNEMLADWASATMVYSKTKLDYNNWGWFNANFHKMNLHDTTRKRIVSALNKLKDLTKQGDKVMADLQLTGWEKAEQKQLIEMYNKGLYKQLLEHYCHEGVNVRYLNLDTDEHGFPIMSLLYDEENWICSKGNMRPVQVYICSKDVVADTVEQGMKFLGNGILEKIKTGILGC